MGRYESLWTSLKDKSKEKRLNEGQSNETDYLEFKKYLKKDESIPLTGSLGPELTIISSRYPKSKSIYYENEFTAKLKDSRIDGLKEEDIKGMRSISKEGEVKDIILRLVFGDNKIVEVHSTGDNRDSKLKLIEAVKKHYNIEGK